MSWTYILTSHACRSVGRGRGVQPGLRTTIIHSTDISIPTIETAVVMMIETDVVMMTEIADVMTIENADVMMTGVAVTTTPTAATTIAHADRVMSSVHGWIL